MALKLGTRLSRRRSRDQNKICLICDRSAVLNAFGTLWTCLGCGLQYDAVTDEVVIPANPEWFADHAVEVTTATVDRLLALLESGECKPAEVEGQLLHAERWRKSAEKLKAALRP